MEDREKGTGELNTDCRLRRNASKCYGQQLKEPREKGGYALRQGRKRKGAKVASKTARNKQRKKQKRECPC